MTRGRAFKILIGFTVFAVGGASASAQANETRLSATSTDVRVRVPARANIFGAGRAKPPEPGGGGAGVLPVRLSSSRTVTFPSVTGRVNPISDYDDWHGPEGELDVRTDVRSYRGISGFMHRNGMPLVGVFLSHEPPARPAPPTLDFTSRPDRFTLAPRLGQTFLVGNGIGRRYRVPRRATRLFLGFPDAFLYVGPPGWYGNNLGRLIATVRLGES